MALGTTFRNEIMKLVFQSSAISNIADNTATSANTSLFLSLHTGEPLTSQSSAEAAYTSYTRVSVIRSATGFSVSANQVTPVANIDFPAGTGGGETVTHFAVSTELSGAGRVLFSGTVTPNISTGNGITPRLTTSSQLTVT